MKARLKKKHRRRKKMEEMNREMREKFPNVYTGGYHGHEPDRTRA